MSDPFAVVSEVIRGRRTINSFESRVPPESVVLAAIELARWAPNHKLTQPWQFHWLGQETIKATIDVSC